MEQVFIPKEVQNQCMEQVFILVYGSSIHTKTKEVQNQGMEQVFILVYESIIHTKRGTKTIIGENKTCEQQWGQCIIAYSWVSST